MSRTTARRRLAFAAPRTVLVAVVAALSILVVTVLASRVAVLMARPLEARLIERLGEVYLDGLSAAVAPHIVSGREDDLAAALRAVATYSDGVRELRVVVRAPDGTVLGDLARDDTAAAAVPPPLGSEVLLTMASDKNRLWVQRPIVVAGEPRGVLSAQLDLKPIREEHLAASLKSLAVNTVMAIGLSFAGFLAMRRLLAPLNLLEAALVEASAGEPRPVELDEGRLDPRIRRLVGAYNRMVRASIERRQVQIAHGERLRAADLGRLAATIAHEVRNPLAGMLNAVDTARRFPENRAAVAGSLDLLERGLDAIARVVDTTLSIYRPAATPTGVRRVDFDDLERLIRPFAERQGVVLRWQTALRRDLPLDASIVRQIVLNLALNAAKASPADGEIVVDVREEADGLHLGFLDAGAGLDPAVVARLEDLDVEWIGTGEVGIGLGVVVRAVASLGGRITVARRDGGGSAITVSLPVVGEPAIPDAPREAVS